MQFGLHFPLIRAPYGAYVGVACLLHLSILTEWGNVFLPVHPLELDTYFSLNIVNSTDSTAVSARPTDYHPPPNVYYRPQGSTNFQLVSSELEEFLGSQIPRFTAFDCVFYALELSLFTRHGSNVVIELQALLRNLSAGHTFGIVIMDDVRRKERSGMDLFMDYAKKLGFSNDSPLMTAPINWRIWHVQDCNSHIMQRKDIFKWVCQDVIWRRMQELQSD